MGVLERFDKLVDRSGAGALLDQMYEFAFGERQPSDALRYMGTPALLSGFLPYRGYLPDDEIFENLNSVGWVLEIQPLLGSDERVDSVLAGMFEENFPDEVDVQVSSYASPYAGEVLEKWARPRVKMGGVMEEIGRARAEHFRKMIWRSGSRNGPFMLRDFRCFLSVSMPKKEKQDQQVARLADLRKKIEGSLNTLQLSHMRLNASDLISLIYGWMNMGENPTNPKIDYDPGMWLCDQMLRADTSTEVFRERLVTNTNTFGKESYRRDSLHSRSTLAKKMDLRTYSVARLPKLASQGFMMGLLGHFNQDALRLSGAVWSTLKISYKSAERSLAESQMRSARAARQYQSPFKGMFPKMIAKADEWRGVNGHVQDGARLVNFTYSVMTQTPEGTGEETERALRGVYRNQGWELERNDCAHLPVMLSCLPMGFGDGFERDLQQLKFMRTGLSRHMPALAPLQGQPKGGPLPHVMLTTRLGQPMYFSPFQNEGNGNHNMTVTGASGSGKSVLMQAICADGLAQGYHGMVIDDGRSFETLCKVLGGDHVVFKLENAICVNPFSLVSERALADQDERLAAMNSIVQVIALMARGDEGCTREELGLIDGLVGEVWQKKNRRGSVWDVYSLLKRAGTSQAENLASALRPYAEGTYREFFEGEASLAMKNPFTVFEMSDLESMKELRSVVVLCLLFQIEQRMQVGGRRQRKMVIIDEAWQMLGGGPAGKFIEGFARRARKEGGALITGTQSVNDYYANSGAQAAFENSDWRIVMRVSSEEADGLKDSKRLALDDQTLPILKSLRMSPGEYSEMMVFGPGTRFVARLVLDPFSAAMYSSSPDVYSRIQDETRRGKPLLEVVREIALGASNA